MTVPADATAPGGISNDTAAAIERGDLSPGCGNPECPCRTRPREVCEEWMGFTPPNERPMPFCPRCGWAEHLHPKIKDAGSSE